MNDEITMAVAGNSMVAAAPMKEVRLDLVWCKATFVRCRCDLVTDNSAAGTELTRSAQFEAADAAEVDRFAV